MMQAAKYEKDGRLLTQPGGTLDVGNDVRAFLAAFESGRLVVAHAYASQQVAAIRDIVARGRQAGLPLRTPAEHVDTSVIADIYKIFGGVQSTNRIQTIISGSQAKSMLENLIREGVAAGANDVFIRRAPDAGRVSMKIDGYATRFLSNLQLTAEHADQVHRAAFELAGGKGSYEGLLPQNARVSRKEGTSSLVLPDGLDEIRFNWISTHDGREMAMRFFRSGGVIGDDPLPALALPKDAVETLRSLIRRRQGVLYTTGGMGHGKSTLLYALAEEILIRGGRKVHEIADPCERHIPGVVQHNVNAQAGTEDHDSLVGQIFAAVLRHAADVIILQECRSGAMAARIQEAALSNHLILATLHAASEDGALSRLRNLGLSRESGLYEPTAWAGIVSQRLIPTLCECAIRLSDVSEVGERNRLKATLGSADLTAVRVRRREGCDLCRRGPQLMDRLGLKGRTPVISIMVPDQRILDLHQNGHPRSEIIRHWVASQGGVPLATRALQKVLRGEVALEYVEDMVIEGNLTTETISQAYGGDIALMSSHLEDF
ncbi:hypothetical protein GE253_23115 [Niveispirillum sp. SYP-B3756]|uniref:ATPase, T2SS/T4P/T4SS family n=1 Tax=Niveispirillum sp. SYP-B3756 TaxID=2662178 RepID=UPI0012928BC9|nr:ATPase, T2SS/T4P/T4SS family [Niveispirillum sp. SYP-B3756]MQP68213.1 hypothetical protein [Niveispirillum sp. SYP-B3756]